MTTVTATRLEMPAVLGGLLAALASIEALARVALTGMSTDDGLARLLLAVATTLPLALLPPTGAAAVIAATAALSLVAFDTLTIGGLAALLIALFHHGERPAPPESAAAAALPFLALALAGSRPAASEAAVLTLLAAVLAAPAVLAGIALQARREAEQNSAAREVIAGTLVEHVARGERARIARDLHDIVAHHISMVVVQAETAPLTTPGLPADGAQRLAAIGDTARAALTEMRRLLGVLREDASEEAAERRPQPGLEQLNDLLDEARRSSGIGARLILHGAPRELDPGVELVAYRIVQEALTNARRHAPGAAVDVELHYVDRSLQVRVRDNGPGPPRALDAGGHGIAGMRERAAAVGGSLRTGSAVGGGFLIEATLPIEEHA
jgi:signal transduction histidine kinase